MSRPVALEIIISYDDFYFSLDLFIIQDSLVLQEKSPSHQMLNKLGWTSYEAICITYHVLCLVRQPTRKLKKEGKIIQNLFLVNYPWSTLYLMNRYKYLYLDQFVICCTWPKVPGDHGSFNTMLWPFPSSPNQVWPPVKIVNWLRGANFMILSHIAQMKEVQIEKYKYKYKLYPPSHCAERIYRIWRNVKTKILLCSRGVRCSLNITFLNWAWEILWPFCASGTKANYKEENTNILQRYLPDLLDHVISSMLFYLACHNALT